MKKIYTLILSSIVTLSLNAQSVEGTWMLSPQAGALGVGPNQGDGSWWSNSSGDVTTRDCLFDDSLVFDANGNFMHYMDGNTWLESWQGVASEQCGAPVAPHDGSGSYTYTYSNNQLTVNGTGAHIGLAKVTNAGEISAGAPVASTITYDISWGANGEMIADINFGGGWWRFIYTQTTAPPPPPPVTYDVTFQVHTDLISGNVSGDGIYIGGGFVGGNDALLLADADNDGVWEGTMNLPAAGGHFTILNGNCSDWSCKEDISGQACADPNNYNDRNNLLGGFTQDTTLILQYGSCTTPSGVGINDNELNAVSVYPNPASELINITSNSNIDNIIIRDLLGKEVMNLNNINHPVQIIDVSNLSNNIYLVEIQSNNNTVMKKITLTR